MTSLGPLKVADTGLSAQDIISLPKALIKYGLIRRKNPTITFGKWPHRFIVLLRDSVYVYHDEKSKSPTCTFSLLGYNRVKRASSKKHDWCFAVLPDPTLASIKPEKFACVSDAERKEWMVAIRTQMYPANNMDTVIYRPLSFPEDDEYLRIEEPVYDPKNRDTDTISSTSEDESSSDSEIEEKIPVYVKTRRSYSVPQVLTQEEVEKLRVIAKVKKGSIEPLYEKDENVKKHEEKMTLTRIKSVPPRYSDVIRESELEIVDPVDIDNNTDYTNLRSMSGVEPFGEPIPAPELYDVPPEIAPQPPPPVMCRRSEGDSSGEGPPSARSPPIGIIPPLPRKHGNSKPTRFSAEPANGFSASRSAGEADDDDEDYYVHPSDEHASLEALCTVDDTDPDRDHIIRLLQAKKLSGTYLIRKSRQGDEKVLAYLTASHHVKEYKIYSLGDQVFLKRELMFDSLDELLRHYTYNCPLPVSNDYLKYGYNAVQ